jgi:hypothetical protein
MVVKMQEIDSTFSQSHQVFILGAGFTKAFLPAAPLMVDDYDGEGLASKFKEFPHASRLLDWERSRDQSGRINIERLMTRLEGRMPYDFDQRANEELDMLLIELKRSFIQRIRLAREKSGNIEELQGIAKHCVSNGITCITFNYDDVFDEALWKVAGSMTPISKPYWNPDGGYGFFCRPSACAVEDISVQMDIKPAILLLKLHGSINWYPRRGYLRPYSVDAIMHHEAWYDAEHYRETEEAISMHIEPEPFLVPPVLVKSAIVEQPILRLLWSIAYKALLSAQKVIFIGYSCPLTDIAVRTLFEESLRLPPRDNIFVVNLASNRSEQRKIINKYREVFSYIPEKQFNFGGALEWARTLTSSSQSQPQIGK